MKENNSPVRGRTWSGLVQNHFDLDPTLKNDADLEDLSIASAITKMDELTKQIRDLSEKTVA
eukprot:996566-Heterocapsa_arctica.AAC.1